MNISRDTSKRTGFFLHVAGIKAGISLRSTALIIFLMVCEFFLNLKENGQIDIGIGFFTDLRGIVHIPDQELQDKPRFRMNDFTKK
jgi:hypothetical protein